MTLPRVLSYPPVHDYVDRLHGHAATLVRRDQPWPRLPDLYDPAWIVEHADEWDVAHLHFTWEQYHPRTLEAVLAAHASGGTPIVWTAHDLRNPHTSDRSHDEDHLSALADAASAVVTLTPRAAANLAERFGRQAEVVPHGPLLSPQAMRRWRRDGHPPADRPLRLFLLAKALRANLDWRTPMEVVTALAQDGVPVELVVHLHEDAVRHADVAALHDPPAVTVETGSRLTTAALCDRVAAADAIILPYRWGTHSGLLELATDVGTQPIVGDVGFLRQQAPCHLVRLEDRRLDAGHLAEVLREMADGARWLDPVPIALRERTLKEFRSHHASLYGRLRSTGQR